MIKSPPHSGLFEQSSFYCRNWPSINDVRKTSQMGGGGLGDCKGLETWYLNQAVPKKVGQSKTVTYLNFKRDEEKLCFLVKSLVLF